MATSCGDSDLMLNEGRSPIVEIPKQRARRPELSSSKLDAYSEPPKDKNGIMNREANSTSPLTSCSDSDGGDEDEPREVARPGEDDECEHPTWNVGQSEDDGDTNRTRPKKRPVKPSSKSTTATAEKAKSKSKTSKKKKVGTVRMDWSNQELVKKRVNEDHKKLINLREDKKQLKKQLEATRNRVVSLTGEKGQLQKSLTGSEDTVREITAEQLELLAKNRFEVEPDSIVQPKLSAIFRAAKSWSKTWAREKWTEAATAKAKNVMAQLNQKKSEPFATQLLAPEVTRGVTPVSMALNAFLNNSLCLETFERPFALVSHTEGNKNGEQIELSLRWLMDAAEKKSRADSNKLRASILRSIDDSYINKDDIAISDEPAQDLPCWYQSRACEIVDDIFTALRPFLKDLTERDEAKCRQELLRPVDLALQCSSVLGCQNPEIKVSFLYDLPGHQFSPKDSLLIPHPAMKLQDDEADDSGSDADTLGLIGQPIDMVVEPVVFRNGNKAGENYDRSKVLHQGVAWMVKDKDLRTAAAAAIVTKAIKIQAPEGPTLKDQPRNAQGSSDASEDRVTDMTTHGERLTDKVEVKKAITPASSPGRYGLRTDPVRTWRSVELEKRSASGRKDASPKPGLYWAPANEASSASSKKSRTTSNTPHIRYSDDPPPISLPSTQNRESSQPEKLHIVAEEKKFRSFTVLKDPSEEKEGPSELPNKIQKRKSAADNTKFQAEEYNDTDEDSPHKKQKLNRLKEVEDDADAESSEFEPIDLFECLDKSGQTGGGRDDFVRKQDKSEAVFHHNSRNDGRGAQQDTTDQGAAGQAKSTASQTKPNSKVQLPQNPASFTQLCKEKDGAKDNTA